VHSKKTEVVSNKYLLLSELMRLHSQLSIVQPGMVQVKHAEMQKEFDVYWTVRHPDN